MIGQINSALTRDPKTEFEPDIPTHAKVDDLAVEMAALEEIINAGHPGSLPLTLRSHAYFSCFGPAHQALRPRHPRRAKDRPAISGIGS